VVLLGDFNAHTSTLDDRGVGGDGVFDEMGAMGQASAGGAAPTAPPRVNVDRTPPGDEGRLLVDSCVATKCLILNGRAQGDEQASATFVGWDGMVSTVVDYGIVSRGLFPHVQRFVVHPRLPHSDHNSLMLSVKLPIAESPGAGRSVPMPAKWDPDKRDDFRRLLNP
jgi:hypothetical protein